MKTSLAVSAVFACALSAPTVWAQQNAAPAKLAAMGMEMDMSKDKPMSPTPEKMKGMQAQMDKIHQTTDPKERQKLMDEHMRTMQENMKAMRGMGGATMKGEADRGAMAMGDKKPAMNDGDTKARQDMTERRMDMMQMMMEQMMQRDQGAQPMSHM